MAKTLKQILDGVKSSKTKNKDVLGSRPGVDYAPKAGDERKFADKHEIEKHADRAGNGDDVYQATNVKSYMDTPKAARHGYKAGEDEKVYEESKCNKTKAGVECPVHGMKNCLKESDPIGGDSNSPMASQARTASNLSTTSNSKSTPTLEQTKCNMTEEGKLCEVHGMKACPSKVLKEKPVKEEKLDEAIKTTHENPLVSVYDKDGLHTHANLSAANSIHNTNVKHKDVHRGPVTTKSGWEHKRSLRFELSPHHIPHMVRDANEEVKLDEFLVQNYISGTKDKRAEVHKLQDGSFEVKKYSAAFGGNLVNTTKHVMPDAAHAAAKKHLSEEVDLSEGELIARKIVMNQRGGEDHYELHHHGHGKTAWHSIIKTHQDGKSTMNDSGGHSPLHVGSEKYVKNHWNNIKNQKPLPADHPFRMKEEFEQVDEKAIARGKQTMLVTMKKHLGEGYGTDLSRGLSAASLIKKHGGPKVHFTPNGQMIHSDSGKVITPNADQHSVPELIKHAQSFKEEVELDEKAIARGKQTMLVTMKKDPTAKSGGATRRIKKSEYDPKIHSLAEGMKFDRQHSPVPSMRQPSLKAHMDASDWHRGHYEQSVSADEKAYHKDRMLHHTSQVQAMKSMGVKEDVEQIDELSKKTLKGYVKGAHVDLRATGISRRHSQMMSAKPGDKWDDEARWLDKHAKKRAKGIDKALNKIDERHMTSGETKKREEVVMSLKKKLGDFRKRYGSDRGKSVMYATATKVAKGVKEDLAQPLIGSTAQPRDNSESVDMVKTELRALANKAMHLVMNMPQGMHVDPWVQAKIAQAKEMVSSVHDYMIYGDHKEEDEQAPAATPVTFPNYNVDPGATGIGQNI